MKEAQAVVVSPEPEAPMPVAVREPDPELKQTITAAQAKVDAVGALTMKAYERASTLQFTPEEIKALQVEFPDEAFQPGAGGKEHLIYIEHAHLRDRLNQVIGLGQWAIIPRSRWAEPFTTGKGTEGSRVYVEAMLVIRGAFVAEAVGAMEYYPKNESQNYGDAVEGAKTAALRRCCKELGIGLQAWKKEWCEGWWARKRGGRVFKPAGNAPGRSGGVSKPMQASAAAPTQQSATNPPANALQPKPERKCGGPKARDWMIAQFGLQVELAQDFAVQSGKLLPNETLKELPFRWVPISQAELESLIEAMEAYARGGEAKWPWPAHEEPEPAAKAKESTRAHTKPIEVPRDTKPAQQASDLPAEIASIIVPVPRKGQKRDEYLKHPDTIGSLYAGRHDDEECRRRLFGFMNHFEAKRWGGPDGNKNAPSEADKKFRDALDKLAAFLEDKHPEEVSDS